MAKNDFLIFPSLLVVSILFFAGCEKNNTKYYPDAEDPGLGIFSNTGNNLLSCYGNDKPWRSIPRITITTLVFPQQSTSYEVWVTKQITSAVKDTLTISWRGYFEENNLSEASLSFSMPVAKDFSFRDLSALNGQRLHTDGSNGFFSTTINGLLNAKGNGDIYFNSCRLDSIGPGNFSGKLTGLLEADFGTLKITRGRFDHVIKPEQVRL